MAMDFLISSIRWGSRKFLWSLIFAPLLLAPLAPQLVAQSKETQAIPLAGKNVSAVPLTPGESMTTSSTSGLRLEAGDLIEVAVYNVPELTTKARVSSKGEIDLPLINYVHVADLTADEAENLIEKRLSDGGFVKNPHVTLFVDQYASEGASVLGEVA